jgi:hypothetical protein
MDTNSHSMHPVVNTEVGYDHSDLSVRGIIIFLVGVGIAGIGTHLVIWALFVGAQKFVPYETSPNPMATMETMTQAPPLQNAGPQSVVKFPEPRLQTDDTADMSKFKNEEDMRLYPSQPYQTSDGAIHININDAMTMIAQRGLPTRQPGQENAAGNQANQKQNVPAPAPGAKPAGGAPGLQ